ncbi:capsular biosynthesis protein, partial [Campylobacter novaezeelandiae]
MQDNASYRIKNTLSYKLGLALINFNKKINNNSILGGGIEYLKLIKELYILKRTHQKQKILYKQITQIFPELTYTPL